MSKDFMAYWRQKLDWIPGWRKRLKLLVGEGFGFLLKMPENEEISKMRHWDHIYVKMGNFVVKWFTSRKGRIIGLIHIPFLELELLGYCFFFLK